MRPPVDTIIGDLASSSYGVVTRTQLLGAGVSDAEIKWRLGTGALLREHRGVYRVGHRAPSTEASYLAAVWACGEGAVLCGRAAAHLHGLVKGAAPPPDVASPNARRLRGGRARRLRVDPLDATRRGPIPVTTVARTLVDLAPILGEDRLARACHEAGVLHRTTPREVEEVLARRPNAPGARKLRAILRGEVQVTLSALERRFLVLLEEAGLPLPRTNRPAGTKRVDCRWPEHRLTVELDSYRFHSSRHAWEQDRRREREARARGDDFRRFTHRDVFESPAALVSELRSALRQLAATPSPLVGKVARGR